LARRRQRTLQHGNEDRQLGRFDRRLILGIVFPRKYVQPNPRLTDRRLEGAADCVSKRLRKARSNHAVPASDQFDVDYGHAAVTGRDAMSVTAPLARNTPARTGAANAGRGPEPFGSMEG